MNEIFDQLMEEAKGSADALPPLQVALRLAIALAIGWLLGFVYRRTHTGTKFTPAIPHAQVLLAVGGALIWLVVADNLVRAFGLAGTIGLIRYRTRIRDPKDTTVLLFSMILGMACGLGAYAVALIGSAFVVFTLYWLDFTHRRTLTSWGAGSEDLQKLLDIGDNPEKRKPDE